ncbi:DUF485 domain-containing protein [Helicobacter sp. MIT 05-5293]|uniref:DUF485 domain-containing protein n=1 Tax=Helicobacter sp. MIT 05-5293 TaxID=1548149 RepID=UPI00051DEC94|nr:DUF485 domain-containing protein [Helicobacter sp. MIT 05-5293]TLD80955.1 DUF485 domain-containing protein [Helicobacter sp. MIT 05-5293]
MKIPKNQQKALAKFRNFVSFRNKISLILSLIVLGCYYVFIVGVGMFPEILGYRLGPSSVTLGILVGMFLIALCVIATGLYTFLANWYFDKDQESIIEELKESGAIEALQSGKISYKDEE